MAAWEGPPPSPLWLSDVQLGVGGFAQVLWGKLGDGTDVACKLLLPMYCNGDDESYEARSFRKEAQMLMRLQHNNIVTCYGLLRLPPDYPGLEGHGYQHPTWVLVLELCQGRHLGDLLWRQMNNPSTELYSTYDAVCWMHDVACALQHMHSASPQILHRDMKQENVLLSVGTGPDAGRLVAKVADLGLSKAITPAVHARRMHHSHPPRQRMAGVTSSPIPCQGIFTPVPSRTLQCFNATDGPGLPFELSQPQQLAADGLRMNPEQWQVHNEPAYNLTGRCGSKVYMAPEVFKGEPYNEKADMFGFANLCYEVFSRTMLLEEYLRVATGSTELGSMEQQQELEHAYAVAVTEGHRPARHACIPSAIWEIIEACWRQDPRERPSSAAAVERLASIREALSPAGQGRSRYASPGLQQVVQRGRWWEAVQRCAKAQQPAQQQQQQQQQPGHQTPDWSPASAAALLAPSEHHPSPLWLPVGQAGAMDTSPVSVLGKRPSEDFSFLLEPSSPPPQPVRRRQSNGQGQAQQLAAQAQQLAQQTKQVVRKLQLLQQQQQQQAMALQAQLQRHSPTLVGGAPQSTQPQQQQQSPAAGPGPLAALQDLAALQQTLLSMALPEGQQQVALAAMQQLAAVLQGHHGPPLPGQQPKSFQLQQTGQAPASPDPCTPARSMHHEPLVLPPEPPSPPLHEAHRSPQQQQQQQALPALPCALLEPLLSPKQLAAMLRQQRLGL